MSSVLWSAMFFETSSDAECDCDLAVKQLEHIAWHLRQMSPEEQRTFRAFAERAAAAEPSREVAAEILALVSGLLPD